MLAETEGLPPFLQTGVALDAWNVLAVVEQTPWLSRLLATSIQAGTAPRLRQSRPELSRSICVAIAIERPGCLPLPRA
ncbi:DUF1612 domain-containing protein [Sinorhizobium fredii]|uniref:DUF1612 domain-containing protein n=1 Tax=Rhizobium fredii TaxID=380 RepID=UPI001E64950A|nr:DUF1612 domain-containing protein [Sinorhizobium fredii]